jgi:hypothetical protein
MELFLNPLPYLEPMQKSFLFYATFLLCAALLFSPAAHAQLPGDLDQLPVEREPHHTILLKNSYLRLLEGHVATNDTTPLHRHAANSVVVFLSNSTFGIQIPGDTPVLTIVKPGDFRYSPYGDKPVNHLVWNQTPGDFHFYVVEVAKKPVIRKLDSLNGQPLNLAPAPYPRLLIDASIPTYKYFPPDTPVLWKKTAHGILIEII